MPRAAEDLLSGLNGSALRRRPVRRVLLSVLAALALVAVACGGGDPAQDSGSNGSAPGAAPTLDDEGATGSGSQPGGDQNAASDADSEGDRGSGASASGGDDAVGDHAGDQAAGSGDDRALLPVDRGSALPTETGQRGPMPVSLSISSIDVSGAPVRDVGVEVDGQMEIPGAEEVGWYRFGALPGEEGSSVLAAHIAYNGVDGVFRHLDRAEEGDVVTVEFDDGSSSQWVVRSQAQYEKDALPDDIWERDGEPRLVLITCGGDFNPELRSYDSNVVLYAEPLT